jgi:hypothetical protein
MAGLTPNAQRRPDSGQREAGGVVVAAPRAAAPSAWGVGEELVVHWWTYGLGGRGSVGVQITL